MKALWLVLASASLVLGSPLAAAQSEMWTKVVKAANVKAEQ